MHILLKAEASQAIKNTRHMQVIKKVFATCAAFSYQQVNRTHTSTHTYTFV